MEKLNFIKHLIKQLIIKKVSATSIAELQNPGMGLVEAGYGTYGTNHLIIHSWDSKTKLRIGKYCSIADNVHIFLGGNHDTSRTSTFPFGSGPELIGPSIGHPSSNGDIVIGNDVWIASHVSIMSGITIGDGAVIAAFSHVVKDVHPYEIVGGNPAKHIRFRVQEDLIPELLSISWWNWPKQKIIKNRGLLVQKFSQETLNELRKLD